MKTTTGYAVLIVLCLASYGGMRSAKDIAAFTGIPAASVVQAASKLRQAGLIDSMRGHAGGYCLPGSAENMSLFDIVEAMEGREDVAALAPVQAHSASRKFGTDPVSDRGLERFTGAVQALALVGLDMEEVLRQATLDKLVLGLEAPDAFRDLPGQAATPSSHAAQSTRFIESRRGKDRPPSRSPSC